MRRFFPLISFFFIGLAGGARADNLYRDGVIKVRSADVYTSWASWSVRTQVRQGERVKVYDRRGERYLIQIWRNMDRIDGWIDASVLDLGGIVKPTDTVGGQRTFPAVVLDGKAQAFERNNSGSRVLAVFKKGERVDVLSQYQEWFRIRLTFVDGSVGAGWIPKTGLELQKGSAASTPAPKRVEAVVSESEEESEPSRTLSLTGFRFDLGPIFSIHNFNASQFRIGGAADLSVAKNFSIGLPVSYAKGGGFSALQAGVDLLWRVIPRSSWFIYERTGLLFERLSGNGKSFMAATVDLAAGIDYRFWENVSVYLEPISVEVSPLTTKDVPWFVRAQLLTGLAIRW